ncbi:MAG: sulfurtransferase [Saprospiraceae bacterium]|nr:sulfurtransferase [Saprospiraceae bacterium]
MTKPNHALMPRAYAHILFFTVLSSLLACTPKPDVKFSPSGKLIEVSELPPIDDLSENILLVDTRELKNFQDGHIPGAIHIWRDELSDSLQMMRPRDEIAKILGIKGISSADTLIIYDDHGCAEAARLWWVLHYCGFDNTYLLNGGYSHWKRNELPISNRAVRRISKEFQFPKDIQPDYYINKADLEAELLNAELVLLDTRTKAEFDGAFNKKGALSAGHIPGSIWLDYMESVDPNPESDKRILPLEKLNLLFESRDIKSSDNIVTYCHSGARSAQTTFILTQLLKYPNVRNYDGSWIEWSRRQVAVNQAPGE